MGKHKLDYPPGTKLNKLTVISEFTKIENSGRKRRFLQCKCDCGKLHSLIASDFKKVKSCGCIRNTSGGNWKVPEYRMLRCAQKRARERNIEFNITVEDISIPEYCPLLNIKLSPMGTGDGFAPSLDRINPKLGYIKKNVWVISHRANQIKNDATIEELEKITYNFKQLLMEKTNEKLWME
jgi:hypothetical protein